MQALGWKRPDVVLVTGDACIDSPYIGVSVIGKVLSNAGYKVGIIAQPDIHSEGDITRLGEPSLFWGVTSGCMDSMVANYLPSGKPRRQDDLTPGGVNSRRPDMAVIVYTNLIRRYFKQTAPIIIGGIEASLRRISHYHAWSNAVRRSILFDAKADILVYGMGEKTILEIAEKLSAGKPAADTPGLCYISRDKPEGYIELPSHAEAAQDKTAFTKMFKIFYENSEFPAAKGLCQKQDTRYLIQNPPQPPLDAAGLDRIYELDYERDVHPYCRQRGEVRALETIRFSITTHRGCYGDCHFCAISLHQGRRVISRSEDSILKEAQTLAAHPQFKGIIQDVGGPTANMYGIECPRMKKRGPCRNKRCLGQAVCAELPVSHERQIRLLRRIRDLPGMRKVFIGSGIRHDLILQDESHGSLYLEELVRHHVSGQLKAAPEHCEEHILRLMGKPGAGRFEEFKARFDRLNRKFNKKQFLTCYFIAAHPGCTLEDMRQLKKYADRVLKFRPEQVQVFMPTPSTYSTLMYYTETDPETGQKIFVEKDARKKEAQKKTLTPVKTGHIFTPIPVKHRP